MMICCCIITNAQQPAAADSANAKKRIQVISSDRMVYEKKDTAEFQSLVGHVIVKQEKTIFYCDSAIINRKLNTLEAFNHVHINDADSVHTYSDYLKYLGNEKKAFLKGNVKLTDGKAVLTTPELEYTTTTKIGIYTKGGRLDDGKTILNSKEGYYYGETRDAVFKKNVKLKDPEYYIETDTLLYNTYTEIANFTVPTKITSGQNKRIYTTNGYYDKKARRAYFGKRPDIQDGSTFLKADEVANDDSTGFGEARGNVIYRDTAQGITIFSNNLKTNRNDNSFLATQHPVMVLKQEEDADSLFIAADTLYSARLSDLKKSREVPDITEAGLKRDNSPVNNVSQPQPEGSPPGNEKDSSNKIALKNRAMIQKNFKPKTGFNKDSSFASDSLNKAAIITNKETDSTIITKAPSKDSSFANMLDIVTASKNDSSGQKQDTTITVHKQNNTKTIIKKDTSSAKNKRDSTDRFFEAYFNVRIYSDSMQAVGDSMFYSAKDSVFRLFRNPVIWTKDNQVTGDTIYLYTYNKKPKRMYVFENALAINKVGYEYYNQIKGRTINGYFKDGNIEYMRARGNSESVYYGQDDSSKFIGVNKSKADIFDMYFLDRKPQKVIGRVNFAGTMYPMRQVNHADLRLRGFQWIIDRRPKSKYELFDNTPKATASQ